VFRKRVPGVGSGDRKSSAADADIFLRRKLTHARPHIGANGVS